MVKIIWAERAIDDLTSIGDYSSRFSDKKITFKGSCSDYFNISPI